MTEKHIQIIIPTNHIQIELFAKSISGQGNSGCLQTWFEGPLHYSSIGIYTPIGVSADSVINAIKSCWLNQSEMWTNQMISKYKFFH